LMTVSNPAVTNITLIKRVGLMASKAFLVNQ